MTRIAPELVNQKVTRRVAADYLGVSERTIDRYIETGRLPAYRLGVRSIRIRIADLDALEARIPTASIG